uniref:Uncharacterized protein n=1 Tax=Oryza punctata TaxID=4537 RepID=A0A0E0M4F7_ORYPU
MAAAPALSSSSSVEKWSEIDLRDPPHAAAASDKPKHKAFVPTWKTRHLTAMFHNGGGGGNGSENKEPMAASMEGTDQEKDASKSKSKSSWGFDGLKKWKKSGNEEAMAGGDRPENAVPRSLYSECRLEVSPAVAQDAKRAKKCIRSLATMTLLPTWRMIMYCKVVALSIVFSVPLIGIRITGLNLLKVLAENTKKELSAEDQQIETISTRLPVDKSVLKAFFPNICFFSRWAWCDEHGDNVINAAKKEFKERVEEVEKQIGITSGDGWVAFGDNHDENFNPRAFSQHQAAVERGRLMTRLPEFLHEYMANKEKMELLWWLRTKFLADIRMTLDLISNSVREMDDHFTRRFEQLV